MWSWLRRTWWQALACVIGGIEGGTGVSTPLEDPTVGGLIARIIAAAGAWWSSPAWRSAGIRGCAAT